MDPHKVLIEVVSDIEEAKVRLRRAESRIVEADLADTPGYEEIAEFARAALRNAQVASDAAERRLRLEHPP